MSKMSLEKLKSFLWSSADILRGSMDADKYKDYIFAMLFLKRLSDAFEEESLKVKAKFEKQGYDEEEVKDEINDPMNYKESFYIPEDGRWSNVENLKTNIGEKLDKMTEAIENQEGNDKLKGILSDVDFNDKKKLSDAKLEKLIKHFNEVKLRNDSFESDDALGQAYEYLLEKFAGSAGKSAGEFFTPPNIVQLLVDVVGIEPKNKIYDPTCGSGGILISAINYVKKTKGDKEAKTVSINGQELNHSTYAMCNMNMFLHGYKDFDIRQGDTLAEPKHRTKDNELMKFDRVLANPPYSIKQWEDSLFNNDPWGRNKYGEVPSKNADFAFVQTILAQLNENGKAGIVLPHGVLFRGGKEGKIREALLKDDKIEGIIGLPEKLFFNTGIATCIIVLNNNKDNKMKNKVMFVNAELMFNAGKNQNNMSEYHRRDIEEAYLNKKEVSRFCRLVNMEEIKENDYNLNIKRYCDTAPPAEIYDVQGILTGGIPKEEIENEYNLELLGMSGLKPMDILEERKGRFYLTIDEDDMEDRSLKEETVDLLKRWENKYHKTLVDSEKEVEKLSSELDSYLKELGYEK